MFRYFFEDLTTLIPDYLFFQVKANRTGLFIINNTKVFEAVENVLETKLGKSW